MEYFSRAKPRIENLKRKAVTRLRRVRWGRVALITGVVLVALTIAGTGAVVGMALSFSGKLPDVTALYTPPSEATRIFARDGQLIASLFRENRAIVPLDKIPSMLKQAVMAIEDDRFFQHHGVD
ncbi:MAG: transglycosylase domain-containing protein, partial [bacterium]